MSDSIRAKLIEIEAALADNRRSDVDRSLLYGTRQALRAFLQPDVWPAATQTFDTGSVRPTQDENKVRH